MAFHQYLNSTGNYSYNAYFYKDIEFASHFHKNFELIYVISGEVECTVNGKTDILHSHEFALCLSNEIHTYRSLGQSESWVVVFSGDFVHAFDKQTKHKTGTHFKFSCRPEVEHYLKSFLFVDDYSDIYLLKSCLYVVCAEFCRNIELKDASSKSDLLMRTITEYIDNHFQEPITLANLADVSGYDYSYISRCFNKTFNMSFNDYVNIYRIEYALTLLIETDKSITDIAYESGFQSIRNFNHFFKGHVGLTPNKYRTTARTVKVVTFD